MKEFIKEAANIASQHQLLAYTIAGFLLLATIAGRKKLDRWLLGFIVICMVVLAVSPTVAQVILAKIAQNDLYRVTVSVVKSNGTPISNAKVESDVVSGKVLNNGTTQLEIAVAHLPATKTVIISAKDSTGALTGSKKIVLGADKNPNVQITVDRIGTTLRGNVFGRNGNPLVGVTVTIEGGVPEERGVTDDLGAFQFKTHIAEGEAVMVIATNGRHTVQQQHVAGDEPVTIHF